MSIAPRIAKLIRTVLELRKDTRLPISHINGQAFHQPSSFFGANPISRPRASATFSKRSNVGLPLPLSRLHKACSEMPQIRANSRWLVRSDLRRSAKNAPTSSFFIKMKYTPSCRQSQRSRRKNLHFNEIVSQGISDQHCMTPVYIVDDIGSNLRLAIELNGPHAAPRLQQEIDLTTLCIAALLSHILTTVLTQTLNDGLEAMPHGLL